MDNRKKGIVSTVPEAGEVFELTIDEPIDPVEMIRMDGYNPTGWVSRGPNVSSWVTRKFKLVVIGYSSSFIKLNAELKEVGKPALGQWREAFKEKYPHSDGKGPIGFTGSVWLSPHNRPFSPCIYTEVCDKSYNSHRRYWSDYTYRRGQSWTSGLFDVVAYSDPLQPEYAPYHHLGVDGTVWIDSHSSDWRFVVQVQ